MDNQIKIEDWEIELNKILLKHLEYWGLEADFYRNRPHTEYQEYPYPEFRQICEFVSTLLKSQRESRNKELREKVKEEIWQYHTLGQFKDKWGISKEMEDDLNDMFMTAHNTPLEQILSLLKEDIKN